MPAGKQITVGTLVAEKQDEWHLKVLAGQAALATRTVGTSDINRPGMALAGFTGVFLSERIQIIGSTELTYLATLESDTLVAAVDRLCRLGPPCLIVTKGLEPPGALVRAAEVAAVPIIGTPMDTTPFIHRLGDFLDYRLAPEEYVHGDLVDVFGVGLLIAGDSGIGKSECALDLVARGHRLVADDVVKVLRRGTGILMGYSAAKSPLLAHHIEIRGVGIVDVYSLYGIRAVRVQKRIEVEVRLVSWKQGMDYERARGHRQEPHPQGLRLPPGQGLQRGADEGHESLPEDRPVHHR
jgi:HPr kinase/phosphorylase